MLKRKNRFSKSYQVRYVLKNGESFKTGPLLFKSLQKNSTHQAKIAVVVSKKIHKSAVVRNKIRRRVFECVRQTNTQITGFDLVIVVYASHISTMQNTQLEAIISGGIDHITKPKS